MNEAVFTPIPVLLPQEGGYYKAPQHHPELCSENTVAYSNNEVNFLINFLLLMFRGIPRLNISNHPPTHSAPPFRLGLHPSPLTTFQFGSFYLFVNINQHKQFRAQCVKYVI